MKSFYAQYDGAEFPTQDHLFPSDQLLQFITQYGDQALKAIEQMLKCPQDPQQAQLLDQLIAQGLLDRDALGKLRLTPRAINRIQRRALAEVFANLPQGQREGHPKTTPGQGGDRIEGAKPYTYGDNVSELDIHQTLHNALTRQGLPKGQRAPTRQLTTDNWQLATDSWRIRFTERDFELHLHEGATNCSTVILLDQSGSMMRYGRFIAAKQVALAMQALVRSRFPQDTLDIVGFYSGASFIRESFLPLAMPKPVTIYDYHVRLRVPLAKLEHAPQHFTNLHMGLQLARRLLQRRPSQNKQIFIITDGQPTAHLDAGYVYLLYPPDPRSTLATLKEGALALRDGCRICTFALIEDYWGMEWVGFVDQLTKLTKGLAFYTSSADLSTCIMESYLSGRKKKTCLA